MSKNQIYLLGIIQNHQQLPPLGKLELNLTTSGQHCAVWLPSPLKLFANKEEFLRAVLGFLEGISARKIAILPVKMGMSVPKEENLVELLKSYKEDVENFFKLVKGCFEYNLSLVPHIKRAGNQEDLLTTKSPTIHSGKDYIEFIKSREQHRKARNMELEKELAAICLGLAPILKDIRVEKSLSGRGNLEIALLISHADEGHFQEKVANLNAQKGNNYYVQWTGPWPAYHFVSFKFQAERYITSESLNWSIGGEENVHCIASTTKY